VRRDGEAVRLFTRRGRDWTDRHPAIAGAAVSKRLTAPYYKSGPSRDWIKLKNPDSPAMLRVGRW
jgi:ATP-dependent DNA ligase